MRNLKFKNSTIGMMGSHGSLKKRNLIRVAFYESNIDDNITLKAESGHSLSTIKSIPFVVISRDEYENRDSDPYNSEVEMRWAFEKMGIS